MVVDVAIASERGRWRGEEKKRCGVSMEHFRTLTQEPRRGYEGRRASTISIADSKHGDGSIYNSDC